MHVKYIATLQKFVAPAAVAVVVVVLLHLRIALAVATCNLQLALPVSCSPWSLLVVVSAPGGTPWCPRFSSLCNN